MLKREHPPLFCAAWTSSRAFFSEANGDDDTFASSSSLASSSSSSSSSQKIFSFSVSRKGANTKKKKRTTTTTFLERKKDGRKISLFLLSSLLLLLRVVKVVKVVKVARRVVGRRSAVDRDLWWSFSVGGGVVEEDERDIFFSFFLCVWVGVSLSIRNTRAMIRTKHRLPSSVVRQSRLFSFSSCCVYILGFQIMSIFFSRESVLFAFVFEVVPYKRKTKQHCMYPHFKTPPTTYLSHFTQNVIEEEEERHVGRTPVRAASHAQGTTTPTPRATYFFLLSLSL